MNDAPKGATHRNIQTGMYYKINRFNNDEVLFWHSEDWGYSAYKAEDLSTNDFIKLEEK